ncbi:hypothetical protein MXB_3015 [Myxobolus squamalis]|nr:hypothetical protein MXB_3015 [Myxobolus squamalis]
MNKEIFIATIFPITSAPFYQCHIVMAHDLTENIYVLTVWKLIIDCCEFRKSIAKLCKISIKIIKIGWILFSFPVGDSKKNQKI